MHEGNGPIAAWVICSPCGDSSTPWITPQRSSVQLPHPCSMHGSANRNLDSGLRPFQARSTKSASSVIAGATYPRTPFVPTMPSRVVPSLQRPLGHVFSIACLHCAVWAALCAAIRIQTLQTLTVRDLGFTAQLPKFLACRLLEGRLILQRPSLGWSLVPGQ